MIQNPKRKLTGLVQDLATLMFWWNSQEEGRGDNRDEAGKEETVFKNTSPGIITQLWAPTSSCKHIEICLQRAVKPMRRFHWTWKACPKLPLTISRTFNTYSQASRRTENFKWKQAKNIRHKQAILWEKNKYCNKNWKWRRQENTRWFDTGTHTIALVGQELTATLPQWAKY